MKARNRVVTYLSPADIARLDVLVRRRDTSRAQVVRDLVRDQMSQMSARGEKAQSVPREMSQMSASKNTL